MEMYVIFVSIERFDPERRVFLHRGVEAFPEFDEYIWLEEFPAVLRAPDDMVLMLIR